ncbi:MAG TPA: phosphatidylserine decarboxylase [Pseudoneobacillus sp.]|nr:phosphatidylserine decarboxylase [Pseudoneobacillus sp.]
MLKNVYRLLIELTNGKWSSKILKKFAQSHLSKFIVPSFAKTYKINTNEMANPLQTYPTLHDFFIRKLKDNTRPIHSEETSVTSPVDAIIEDIGNIQSDSMIKVKGKIYSITEMLGSIEKAAPYVNGTYMIFYLSPSHYHRIHSPVNGKVIDQWELGGKSYPVNKWGLKYGNAPLSKNYRSITEIDVLGHQVAVVKVGAMFVNSIELTHPNESLLKGRELAYFTFGSTVILLFQENHFSLLPSIKTPHPIKMGEKIGEVLS